MKKLLIVLILSIIILSGCGKKSELEIAYNNCMVSCEGVGDSEYSDLTIRCRLAKSVKEPEFLKGYKIYCNCLRENSEDYCKTLKVYSPNNLKNEK